MIELQGLVKRFGAAPAVDGVSFRAADGEITGLLGANGAGKTTTLRLLTGLLRPDAGAARVDGIEVARAPEAALARLGVLPDAAGLYPHLSVREQLEYAGRLHGLGGRPLAARVEGLLTELGLAALAKRRGSALSLGERRRVGLGRALVQDPPNVVLDEPTNGLDVLGSRAVRALLRRLAGEGRAVLLSSHFLAQMAELCDRVLILARGRVVIDASPAEVCRAGGSTDLETSFVRLTGQEESV